MQLRVGVAFELDERALGTMAWSPMAEWVGDDRDGTAFNLGLRLAVMADRLWLDASWGGGACRAIASGS